MQTDMHTGKHAHTQSNHTAQATANACMCMHAYVVPIAMFAQSVFPHISLLISTWQFQQSIGIPQMQGTPQLMMVVDVGVGRDGQPLHDPPPAPTDTRASSKDKFQKSNQVRTPLGSRFPEVRVQHLRFTLAERGRREEWKRRGPCRAVQITRLAQ